MRVGLRLPGALAALTLFGCTVAPGLYDFDGDGVADAVDCAPEDPAVFPSSDDPVDPDGLDANCDGIDGVDVDGDGHASVGSGGLDCNDDDPAVHPAATEVPDDGLDNDCSDGDATCDADGDGVHSPDCDGDDCDDSSDQVFPGAAEVCDGLDGDCDGLVLPAEQDVDADGVRPCDGDCDDADPAIQPGAVEACDGVDTDCDGTVDVAEDDADLDGLRGCDGDCDDLDPLVAPGLPEVCDGVDTDCDGAPLDDEQDDDGDGDPACAECDDDDPALDVADADGDGVTSCDGDCDDQVASVHPGGADPWGDAVDGNCDGQDGVDADGDGQAVNADPPDCDDDPLSPTATSTWSGAVDACGDGVDQDCDGLDGVDSDGDGVASVGSGGDDCLDDPTDPLAPLTFPGADDQVGNGLDSDCDGVDGIDRDGDEIASVGSGGLDCNDDPFDPAAAVTFPGAADLADDGVDQSCDGVDGVDGDGDGVASEASGGFDCNDDAADPQAALTFPGASDGWGDGQDTDCDGMDGIDLDGDGWAVNGPGVDQDCDDADPQVYPGSDEVWESPKLGRDTDCDGDLFDSVSEADVILVGHSERMRSGASLAGIGDLDGDGVGELLVGATMDYAPGWSPSSAGGPGAAFVVPGADLLVGGLLSLDTVGTTLLGQTPGDRAGQALVAGDVDGDGLPDLLVGAPRHDAVGYRSGAAYLVLGSALAAGGPTGLDGAHATLQGPSSSYRSGTAVAAAGDLDGDGLDDVLIGSPGQDGGAVHLVTGASLAAGGPFDLAVADTIFTGEAVGDQFGTSVAAGDVDGDGLRDVLVGASSNSAGGYGAGGAWLWWGAGVIGNVELPAAQADVLFTGAAGDRLGWTVVALDDVDGDGLGDVLLGAPGAGDGGVAYLFYGASLAGGGVFDASQADVILLGEPDENVGGALASAGDVDGDGLSDVLLGGPYSDDAGRFAGKVHLVLGASVVASGGAIGLDQPDAAFVGELPLDSAGYAVTGLGDLDGDGRDDFAVGAWTSDGDTEDVGRTYVLLSRM